MRGSSTPSLRATYRVQLHAGFTFRDATAIVPYLDDLGISHLYVSPVLAARRGSQHGYDVVDPRRVNPELGTEADLRALSSALHQRGMGLLVDIVPNHMAVGPENPYWEDVLAHGERSPYAKWFDIDWPMHADRRLVLPVLADDLDAVIRRQELAVDVSEAGARIHHFSHSFPVSPDTEPESLQLAQWDPAAEQEAERSFAGPEGGERLKALLKQQHYRLAGWRSGLREVNYRRFFDVNDLVALRAEDPEVFAHTHELTLRLVGDGVIDALRVDHVDGLRNPLAYLRRLRAETDRIRDGGVPIVVEKILMNGEQLRASWPVEGTTGYERLNDIEDLFIDPAGFALIDYRYRARRRLPGLTFESTVRADKRAVLDGSFASDVERLTRLLGTILRSAKVVATRDQIFHGIEEFIAACPVYRSYVDPLAPRDEDDLLMLRSMSLESDVDTIANRIVGLMTGDRQDGPDDARREFIERMQQLTGPAMAKGLEDTAHYAYVALVSRNEVGGAPDRPIDGVVDRWHRANAAVFASHPQSLVAITTHDTKRSGDVRARISALSEIGDEWQRSIVRWRRLNRRHHQVVRGRIVPDPNAELLIYQTLVGIWPSPRAGRRSDDVPDRQWRISARQRMTQYMLKAVREAKLRTSWTEPDAAYEKALLEFVTAILDSTEDDPFLSDLSRLVSRVAPIAQWNTLSRVLLHLTIPGTPDLYQGDESWNFALVDPDNRRPVDYVARRASLAGARANASPLAIAELISLPNAKTLVTHRVLEVRRAHERLFTTGAYAPLRVIGPNADKAVAFARSLGSEHAVIIAPRLVGSILAKSATDTRSDTIVELPPGIDNSSVGCAITRRTASIDDGRLTIHDIPFGLFLVTH